MIPRRIHYCWFSGEPFPPDVERCIHSWHEYMPEYEYILWDTKRLFEEFGPEISLFPCWLRESIEVQKWAFAADFIRVYAVYKYGGIYLDTDCLIHSSLDTFLSNRLFIGREDSPRVTHFFYVEVWLTSHCFGAEVGHPFLLQNLDYYKERHFVTCDAPQLDNYLRFDMRLLPEIQARIAMRFGYDISAYSEQIQQLSEGIMVYPALFFGKSGKAVKYESGIYVIHLCLGNWIDERRNNNVVIDWRFKIRWRILAFLRKIAPHFQYVIFEYTR